MSVPEREPQICPTWDEVRDALRDALNRHDEYAFKNWFEPVVGSIEESEGLTLRLVAPSVFHAQWITTHHLRFIEMIWQQFAPGGRVVLVSSPKTETKAKALQPKPKGEVVQLPLWPEDRRGTPNCFLRSALFAAIYGNEDRIYLDGVLLAVQGDCSIHYTGKQLSQSDKDFLMAALHLARNHPLGHVCHFRRYAFLKLLGRSDNAENYEWLDATITRLIATAVKIRIGTRSFEGNLLTYCERDGDIYKLSFSPQFIKLYGADDWTAVDWKIHKQLSRSPLAQWIYDYAVSHVGTTVKLETLQKLSGRGEEAAKVFNQAFKRAKAMLETETDVRLNIDTNGLVTIDHPLSPSQRRYKAKRAPLLKTR